MVTWFLSWRPDTATFPNRKLIGSPVYDGETDALGDAEPLGEDEPDGDADREDELDGDWDAEADGEADGLAEDPTARVILVHAGFALVRVLMYSSVSSIQM